MSSVLANFFSLFIPASIGVLGSFVLYWHRQRRRRDALRSALLTELNASEYLEEWPDGQGSITPVYDPTSSIVYERAASDLGLLTNLEIECLVTYHSRAESMAHFLDLHSELLVEHDTKLVSHDNGQKKRVKKARRGVDKLELARLRAIAAVESTTTESVEFPSDAETLSHTIDRLKEKEHLLEEYGLAVDGSLTEKGHRFFERELTTLGMQKQKDVLDRERSFFEKLRDAFEPILNYLR